MSHDRNDNDLGQFCERLAGGLKGLDTMNDYREFVRKENNVTV